VSSQRSLTQRLEESFRVNRAREALSFGNGRWTYSDLEREAQRVVRTGSRENAGPLKKIAIVQDGGTGAYVCPAVSSHADSKA
jgi:acyl-CoA synthetase (AMP-forming)/AMP-acid ligase II